MASQAAGNAKPDLTVLILRDEASGFAATESTYPEPSLYGVTDGKAVGTYFEHKFQAYLSQRYTYEVGSSAEGMDFPGLSVDMKVTSIKQPQSSCPFKDARQKIYGLGYSLLVFVYAKTDDAKTATGILDIRHTIFVEKARTADYQTTTGILKILKNNGNHDDIVSFLFERNLLVDEVEAAKIATEIMRDPPEVGYLTVSNAYQWRLQYGRAIRKAGDVDGIIRIR